MKKSLSISLLWKISILVVASLLALGYFSISKVKEHSRETFISDTKETVETLLTFVGNTNSVMMQQLRSYTMLDDVGYTSTDPEKIQQMLIDKSKRRYKWFSQIAYVQYSTGLAYRDNGEIDDVSETPWFKTMKAQRKPKKALQLYADIDKSAPGASAYPICKDAEVKDSDGYCVGFFVGFVPIGYMHVYFDKIKGKSWDAPEGYPILLNRLQDILCAPDKEVVLKEKFAPSDSLQIDNHLIEFVLNPQDLDADGKKVTVTGSVVYNGVPSTMVAGRLAGTEWTMALITPDSTINSAASVLTKSIVIGGIIALVLILAITVVILSFSFRPLIDLNNAFKQIASGDADLRSRLHEGTNDEIGQIQRSFNEYIAGLQEMISDIGKAREELITVESTMDITMKKVQKGLDVVADANNTVKSESTLQNNYTSLLDTYITGAASNSAGINKLLVEQSKLIKDASQASPEDLKKILVAMTGNLKSINDVLRTIYQGAKNGAETVSSLRKSSVNAVSAAERLEANNSEIENARKELESLVKKSYDAITLISERVEGFRY